MWLCRTVSYFLTSVLQTNIVLVDPSSRKLLAKITGLSGSITDELFCLISRYMNE